MTQSDGVDADTSERLADGVAPHEAVHEALHETPHEALHDTLHDREIDRELDRLDDGGSVVGSVPGGAVPSGADTRSEALPFVLTAREHFASAGDIESTGDARVDAATARLEEIPDLPTSDHVAVYDDVHRRLQDALSDAEVR